MNGGAFPSNNFLRRTTCPVHDKINREKIPFNVSRSKSVDCGYGRYDSMVRRGGAGQQQQQQQREMPEDPLFRGRNPFHHSHSVTCAVPSTSHAAIESKAKSVGNLTGSQRPRPNVLELCPNQNTAFDAYRRRYSRSSERSLDFEECWLHDFGSTLPYSRSGRRRSSSKDSGRSYSAILRHEAESQEKRTSIKKGKSLLSLCAGPDDDSDEDDQYRSSKILRPPTRHFYQKGISGVPVKCPAKYMGLAY